MALLQNGSLHAQYPYRRTGGTVTASAAANLRTQLGVRAMSMLTPFAGGVATTSSLPLGWRFDNGWIPPKSGTAVLAANIGTATLPGASAFIAAGAMGKNAEAALSGNGDLTAAGALIVSLVAALTGSGTITNADAVAYLQLAATLAGAGDLGGALMALANASATLSGVGDADVTATASGALAASIIVTGDVLNTANVASSVWGALAVSNNAVGTMGEKLNDAGSAANPWTEVIESGFSAAEVLRIIASAVAGKSSGGPGSPVFRDLGDTKDRITGVADASGNRTSVDYDGT